MYVLGITETSSPPVDSAPTGFKKSLKFLKCSTPSIETRSILSFPSPIEKAFLLLPSMSKYLIFLTLHYVLRINTILSVLLVPLIIYKSVPS